MNLRSAHIGIGVVVILLSLLTVPASAQELFFDDFNAETVIGNTTTLINWNVTDGTVDIIGSGFFDFYPGNGEYLDMDGGSNNAARIATKESFELTPGDYILSFSQGKNNNNEESMNVSVGTAFTTLFSSPAGADPLVTREFNFTVGSLTTGTIVFDHLGGDNQGLVVDNVRLARIVTAVPEPSVLTLLLPTLGAIGVARMRRKKY